MCLLRGRQRVDAQINTMAFRTGLMLLSLCWAGEIFSDLYMDLCLGRCQFTPSDLFYCLSWQVLTLRLWHNLNQWLKGLEIPTHWPVQCLASMSMAITWAGSNRLLEKGWSGLAAMIVVVVAPLNTTQSHSKAASPSPETTADSRCICRWAAWELRTLLFIIVLVGHSDCSSLNSCTKTCVSTTTLQNLCMRTCNQILCCLIIESKTMTLWQTIQC